MEITESLESLDENVDNSEELFRITEFDEWVPKLRIGGVKSIRLVVALSSVLSGQQNVEALFKLRVIDRCRLRILRFSRCDVMVVKLLDRE